MAETVHGVTSPLSWANIPAGEPDIRLVAADMDGTLLNGDHRLPEGFWPVYQQMLRHGIAFVPASGRQYATLDHEFGAAEGMSYIAENGNLVIHRGQVISRSSMATATVGAVIEAVHGAAADHNLGLVVSGLNGAYVERTDDAFKTEAHMYYHKLDTVADLTAVTDTVLKLAVYDFGDAEQTAATTFATMENDAQVVVSGQHWVDIMNQGVDKGVGLRALQRALDVLPEQTAAFGDYLNDVALLDAAGYSFAVANAHPDLRARARYLAPANTDDGVLRVLRHLLG